jgi:hypothetical protein
MKYRERKFWKYENIEDVIISTGLKTEQYYNSPFLLMSCNGILTIRPGYRWDGASSVAIDTKNIMLPSLVHDALYQLIREGVLQPDDRKRCDEIMYELNIERGMAKIRASSIYYALRAGGAKATKSRIISAD